MVNYTDKLFVSIPEMMDLTGLSRETLMEFMDNGTIIYIVVKSRRMVNVIPSLENLGIHDLKITNKYLNTEM